MNGDGMAMSVSSGHVRLQPWYLPLPGSCVLGRLSHISVTTPVSIHVHDWTVDHVHVHRMFIV